MTNAYIIANLTKMRAWITDDIASLDYDIERASERLASLGEERAKKERQLTEADDMLAKYINVKGAIE